MEEETLYHRDLREEDWREYEFGPRGDRTVYTIRGPVELIYRQGGTTHTVVDFEGISHTLPAPGEKGCVLRWAVKEGAPSRRP